MDLQLDPISEVPLYLQLIQKIRYRVATGRLNPGQDLPPIHKLAKDNQVHPNTVVRAYRELEQQKIVVKRGTVGTYVATGPAVEELRRRLRALTHAIDALHREARKAGVGPGEVIDLYRQRAADPGEAASQE